MKHIYKKHLATIGLVWAAFGILLLFLYMLLVAPQEAKKQTLAKLFERAEEAANKKLRNDLTLAVNQLEGKLYGFIVKPDESSDLIFDIGQLAEEKDVEAFSVETRDTGINSDIPQCENIKKNNISISFMSEFPEFAAFLNSLERHEPVVYVDTFRITRAQRKDMKHSVNMDLKVLIKDSEDS